MGTLNKIDTFDVIKNLKTAMAETLQERLEEGSVFGVLEEHVRQDATETDFVDMTEMEKEIVMRLKENGRQLGGDQGAYADGVLEITFKNKQAASDFMDFLEDDDDVIGYEVEATFENLPAGLSEAAEVDFDDVMFDGHYEFDVIVYIRPDVVQYEPVEVELTDINGDGLSDQEVDSSAIMTEIKRRVKVNFRGRRRVKMQCLPGFKYNPDMKVCEKITGAEVAQNRVSHRRAVRTRRAKGNGYKVRVARKTRKAKRFRKSMGLHESFDLIANNLFEHEVGSHVMKGNKYGQVTHASRSQVKVKWEGGEETKHAPRDTSIHKIHVPGKTNPTPADHREHLDDSAASLAHSRGLSHAGGPFWKNASGQIVAKTAGGKLSKISHEPVVDKGLEWTHRHHAWAHRAVADHPDVSKEHREYHAALADHHEAEAKKHDLDEKFSHDYGHSKDTDLRSSGIRIHQSTNSRSSQEGHERDAREHRHAAEHHKNGAEEALKSSDSERHDWHKGREKSHNKAVEAHKKLASAHKMVADLQDEHAKE